jgi:hypothetical protein
MKICARVDACLTLTGALKLLQDMKYVTQKKEMKDRDSCICFIIKWPHENGGHLIPYFDS